MSHYIAIIEDAGPDFAIGVWFPDLPGCTSAGDDIDEALRNAPEALALYAESFEEDGKPMPRARTLSELRNDPAVAEDINTYIVAAIEYSRARTPQNSCEIATVAIALQQVRPYVRLPRLARSNE